MYQCIRAFKGKKRVYRSYFSLEANLDSLIRGWKKLGYRVTVRREKAGAVRQGLQQRKEQQWTQTKHLN